MQLFFYELPYRYEIKNTSRSDTDFRECVIAKWRSEEKFVIKLSDNDFTFPEKIEIWKRCTEEYRKLGNYCPEIISSKQGHFPIVSYKGHNCVTWHIGIDILKEETDENAIQIVLDSVKTAIKELEKYGYVTCRQIRDERGQMAQNEYLVYAPTDNPDFVPEETAETAEDNQMSCSTNRRSKTHFSVSPSAENPSTVTPQTEESETDTFIKLNNKTLNTNTSIHSFSPAPQSEERNEPREKRSKDNISLSSVGERELYAEIICDNINFYEAFAPYFDKRDDVMELVSIMTDVVCSSSPTIRVNGEKEMLEVVKSHFLKLIEEKINYVLCTLKHNSGRIRNMHSYLITMLYNSNPQ